MISLLPVIVGVTGHRDVCLCREADLRKTFAGVLRELSGNGSAPIAVASGLAPGSDRLAAEVALREGHLLIATLPMPKDEYEAEMRRQGENEESIRQFEELYGASRIRYVVPSEDGPEEARQDLYVPLSKEIGRISHVVVAFWDGDEEERPGGTAWTVQERLGRHGGSSAPGATTAGPVWQIVVRRSVNGNCQCPKNQELFATKWHPPDYVEPGDRSLEDFGKHVRPCVQRFNRDFAAWPANAGSSLEDVFAAVDGIAMRLRWWTNAVWVAIFVSVGLAATSFALFAHWEPRRTYFLYAYAVLSAIAFGIYAWARYSRVQNRGLDYRALAEGLRVANGRRLIGVTELVSSSYLLHQEGGERWIRLALGVFERSFPMGEPVSGEKCVERSLSAWIRPQLSYYTSARDFADASAKGWERVSKAATALSILLALSLMLPEILPNMREILEPWFNAVLILSTVLAVMGALSHNLVEKLAWREHAHSYDRMCRLLNETVDRLQPLDGRDVLAPDEALRLLGEVARVELDENEEWLMAHRARPFEVPGGG